jgi:hypothetical protein
VRKTPGIGTERERVNWVPCWVKSWDLGWVMRKVHLRARVRVTVRTMSARHEAYGAYGERERRCESRIPLTLPPKAKPQVDKLSKRVSCYNTFL